jgi:hypothetical protein
MSRRSNSILTLILVSVLLLGCKAFDKVTSNQISNSNIASNSKANAQNPNADRAEVELNKDGTIPSGSGTERETPAAGKGNVQGKAMFNEQPAVGVDVKLCKTFNQFMGGCTGDTFTAKTDESGEYLIKNVTPGIYEGLTVRVFNTPYYVFATSGIVSAAKYNIEADTTYFAPDSHLFKSDLKLANPKAGAKVAPENLEVKWDAYPDAAYYKLSIFADTSTGAEAPYDYIGRRVEDASIVLDKPLKPGSYNAKVEAYNGNDRKLAQSASDIKFTVR